MIYERGFKNMTLTITTLHPVWKRLKNSIPSRIAPVPPRAWTVRFRPFFRAQLSSPSASRAAALVNSEYPPCGRYSWSSFCSPRMSIAFWTQGKMKGFPENAHCWKPLFSRTCNRNPHQFYRLQLRAGPFWDSHRPCTLQLRWRSGLGVLV